MERRNLCNQNTVEYKFLDKNGIFFLTFTSNSILIRRCTSPNKPVSEQYHCCPSGEFEIKIVAIESIKTILSTEKLPYYINYSDENIDKNKIGFIDRNSGREAGEYGRYHRNILTLNMHIEIIQNTLIINLYLLCSAVDKNSYWDPVSDPLEQKCFDSQLSETFTISVPKERISEFLTTNVNQSKKYSCTHYMPPTHQIWSLVYMIAYFLGISLLSIMLISANYALLGVINILVTTYIFVKYTVQFIGTLRVKPILFTDSNIIIPDNHTFKEPFSLQYKDIMRMELSSSLKIYYITGMVQIPQHKSLHKIITMLIDKTKLDVLAVSDQC